MSEKIESLGALFRRSVKLYGGKLAYRVPVGNEFKDYTYEQAWDVVFESAKALSAAGLRRGDRLVILGESCFEWAMTDWAAQTLGIVTVPIYPTLPPDQSQFIADDAGAQMAVCLDTRLAAKLSGLTIHLLRPEKGEAGLLDLAKDSTLTKEEWNQSIDETGWRDLATLIYTSGTTGRPKGVMLDHRNFVSLVENIRETIPITKDDTFLSFLPLSHVYERFAGHALPVGVGATVAYATSLASLAKDMMKVKPTIMLCVPRFLENVRARIVDAVQNDKPIKQKLFQLALKQGMVKQRGEFAPLAGLLDRLVGAKIREKTGGNIRFFVSGGAALSPHVSEFYIAFGLNVLQGYGLTETTAATALNLPDDIHPATVGPPIRGCEIKIAPDGEILQRGDSVMSGYYNLPDDTRAAIDADGWFHTGDIGEVDPAGRIKITDRKKDILVLGNGKNVAPLPIENKLKESDLVEEAVVLGDGMEYCCALIIPNFERLANELEAKGISEKDTHRLVEMDEVKAIYKEEVTKANKQLADFEKVKKHVLVGKSFSVDDGELTPSLKVRRRVVKDKYAAEIESMQR